MEDNKTFTTDYNEVVYEVTEAEGCLLLREYLRRRKKISKKRLSSLKREGNILCNGVPVTVRHPVVPGDRIVLQFPHSSPSGYLHPEPVPLHIVYEDNDLLILDKPPGMPVHPTLQYEGGTLANGVIHYYREKGEQSSFHPVHRLDKDTSGLIVTTKNSFAAQQLNLQLQKKQLNRAYLGIVEGQVELTEGTINLPILRKDAPTAQREVTPLGKKAITHFSMVERLERYSLVRFHLETGRTHQIRVHMSHLGHPLLGDDLYGGSRQMIKRQALHADQVTFFHPRDGREMKFQSPLPKDMIIVIDQCRSKR